MKVGLTAVASAKVVIHRGLGESEEGEIDERDIEMIN